MSSPSNKMDSFARRLQTFTKCSPHQVARLPGAIYDLAVCGYGYDVTVEQLRCDVCSAYVTISEGVTSLGRHCDDVADKEAADDKEMDRAVITAAIRVLVQEASERTLNRLLIRIPGQLVSKSHEDLEALVAVLQNHYTKLSAVCFLDKVESVLRENSSRSRALKDKLRSICRITVNTKSKVSRVIEVICKCSSEEDLHRIFRSLPVRCQENREQMEEKWNDDPTFYRRFIQENADEYTVCDIQKAVDESSLVSSRLENKVIRACQSGMDINSEKFPGVIKEVIDKAPLLESYKFCESLGIHFMTPDVLFTVPQRHMKNHMIKLIAEQAENLTVAQVSEAVEVFSSCSLKHKLYRLCSSSLYADNKRRSESRRCNGSVVKLALFSINNYLLGFLFDFIINSDDYQASVMKHLGNLSCSWEKSKIISYINNKHMPYLSTCLQQMDSTLMTYQTYFVDAWKKFLPLRSGQCRPRDRIHRLSNIVAPKRHVLTQRFILLTFVLQMLLAVSGGYIVSQKTQQSSSLERYVDEFSKKIDRGDTSVISDCLHFAAYHRDGTKLLPALISKYKQKDEDIIILKEEEATLNRILFREEFICTEEIDRGCEVHLPGGYELYPYDGYMIDPTDAPIPRQVELYVDTGYDTHVSWVPTTVAATALHRSRRPPTHSNQMHHHVTNPPPPPPPPVAPWQSAPVPSWVADMSAPSGTGVHTQLCPAVLQA